ncbi:MAG TPA: hypothetical protein VE135_25910 [Pyrinomonadaceae bacterium]|nr:hypothetical protein [Pyrinomonadaceae bacterium]
MERDKENEPFNVLSRRRRLRRRLDLLLRMYSLMGLLIAILAAGYFLLTLLPYKLSERQQMALIAGGIGIALAVMSRILVIYRTEQESEEIELLKENESLSSFLDTWAKFERTSKETLSKQEDFNIHSLRSVISRLYEEGKISKEDVIALDEAVQIRNSIVHGGKTVPPHATEKVIGLLVDIIKKITMA